MQSWCRLHMWKHQRMESRQQAYTPTELLCVVIHMFFQFVFFLAAECSSFLLGFFHLPVEITLMFRYHWSIRAVYESLTGYIFTHHI